MKDIDRPLNKRGRTEGKLMAERLREKGLVIDQYLCSPAKRTRETVEFFLQSLKAPETALKIVDDLYEPSIQDFEKAILSADNNASTIAIISHNPGITYYAGMVTEVSIDHMPTTGIFVFGSEAKTWAEFLHTKKEFLFFESPKIVANL